MKRVTFITLTTILLPFVGVFSQDIGTTQSETIFPTWFWYAVIGTAILGFVIFRYKKFLNQKFAYNIFSVSIIVCLMLSFGILLLLNYSLTQSPDGKMWGISTGMFKFLLIAALVVTIGILYYYNFRKTNWYLAIFNVVLQSIAVGFFAIIAIVWILLKLLGAKSSSETESSSPSFDSSANTESRTKPVHGDLSRSLERNLKSSSISPNVVSSTSVKGLIKPYNGDLSRAWEWDGNQLKPYHGDLSRAWEWNGNQLKPYHGDLSRAWEWNGNQLKPYHGDLSRAWEWDGNQLKPYHGDLSRAWEWNGRQLKPYHADLSRAWEIEGDIPIPVIAKAAGII